MGPVKKRRGGGLGNTSQQPPRWDGHRTPVTSFRGPWVAKKNNQKLFGLALMLRIDKTESRCAQAEKSRSFVISVQQGKSGAVLNASLLPSGVGKRK